MGAAEEIKTYKIKEVEIFSAGTWNGDKYSISDLHEMVNAFNKLNVGFRPYLKLGHDNKQKVAKSSGLPSVGWVERLYVKGEKLFADFDYIPEKVFKLIESRAYRKVSCEVYWDLEVDGTKFPKVIGAVALLGAENPGVMNLDDILGLYAFDELKNSSVVFKALSEQDNFKTYTTNFETKLEDNLMEDKVKELEAQLAEQKKNYDLEVNAKAELQKQIEAEKAELEALRADKVKAELEAKSAKIAQFASELESKKLSTPAMKDLITEFLSDKKEYSVGEKKYSREDLLTEILTLSKEAAKVNFDESSLSTFGKKEDKMKGLEEKIEKYQKDHKCDYTTAYKQVMKSEKTEDKE